MGRMLNFPAGLETGLETGYTGQHLSTSLCVGRLLQMAPLP